MAASGPLALELAHIWHKLSGRRRRRQAAAKRAFQAALSRLGPADVAIDLGANAGEFTGPMADTGAQVYAFEPDPHALKLLRLAVGDRPNVSIVAAAAGTEPGKVDLYRKQGFDRAPDRASKSSSILAEKRNVAAGDRVEVELLDFPAFLTELDRDIALIKMDIEGAEVALMEALMDRPVADRIGAVFVETHERKLPQLAGRTAALKRICAGRVRPQVNWDWH